MFLIFVNGSECDPYYNDIRPVGLYVTGSEAEAEVFRVAAGITGRWSNTYTLVRFDPLMRGGYGSPVPVCEFEFWIPEQLDRFLATYGNPSLGVVLPQPNDKIVVFRKDS